MTPSTVPWAATCWSTLATLSSLLFFFFSSRRRHTRCLSDWSSDVSSSDLALLAACAAKRLGTGESRTPASRFQASWPRRPQEVLVDVAVVAALAELRHDAKDEPLRIEIGRASCKEKVVDVAVAATRKTKKT